MQKKINVESNYEKNNITGLMKRFSRSNIREEDVKKFLFMRKIKSDTELLILKVSLILSSFPKNYKFITDIKESENKEINLDDIYRIIKTHPERKDKKEIIKLNNFFVSVGLHKVFEFPNYSDQMIEKLLIYCCINVKSKLFKRNTFIYNINSSFDKFYILIKGKVGIYKTIKKQVVMSGFNYFQYIFNIYLKNDEYLLKLVLENNYELFPINISMMENLNINLAKYILCLLQNNQEYINAFQSKEEVLKMCYINEDNFSDIKLDQDEDIENNSIYQLLSNIKDKNNINTYEYLQIEFYNQKHVLETFNNNDIISIYNITNNNINYEYDKIPPRNYTLKALSDSLICYFDLQEYIYYFMEIYKLYMREQAYFILNNYIFQKISKHFEQNYFNFFEFEEVKANHYLFKENSPVEYIYLLKKGFVELSISKNIFNIHDLINKLNSNLDYPKNISYKETKDIDKKIREINIEKGIMGNEENKKLNENKKEKIVILEQTEIIGIECVYLGINYFYEAKLGNKDAKFYKIRKDKFLEILELEQFTGINLDYQKEVQRKINFFLLRLINLTKIKINNIKIKKFHNMMNIYNKINIGRNYKKVKLNLLFNKTKLKLKSINNNKDIITSAKNKNSNQSPINNINILQLNNSESDMPNNNIRKEKIKINNMKNALMNQRSNTMNDLNKYNDNELLKINKTVPKINIDNQVFLSLKKEENIVNRLFQKISNDNLFFSKIINEDNKLKNLKLKEKSKILKSNNSYNGDIYDNWKTFHLNTNIDSVSHRKKLSKINWYKNIDKFPFNSDENRESNTNRIFYGIQVDKKRVTFIEDKIFYKNYSFLHTENEKYKI